MTSFSAAMQIELGIIHIGAETESFPRDSHHRERPQRETRFQNITGLPARAELLQFDTSDNTRTLFLRPRRRKGKLGDGEPTILDDEL